ncbi:SGNH/GDSL hydrolase family protein [Roseobacter sp. YSTF-M11]|uniref:SGNH/GDSL hydrolase family protein n=1 Tax=Roseobacter insulae TaxID=2859783 RepID=A0A9X1FVT1_9RHOB|nr:SGNH/GDSL hydrolase family protein [Roseobacter insulae]MBW4708684.1 SGNH/GDSL hydrolase family protein [Roseobacter insulae]
MKRLLSAPVLVAQALYVIARTPRLPEPEGHRTGEAGQGRPLRLLIVGDSSAAGVGADQQEDALSGQLVAPLAAEFCVSWRLIAQTGLTTRKLTERLAAEPGGSFDIAVTALGVNDVTRLTPADRWVAQTRALHELLRSHFGVSQIYVTAVPPLQAFPALPDPLAGFLGRHAAVLSSALSRAQTERTTARVVQPDWGLDPDVMASDGFHPGPALYQRWGAEMARHILSDLREPAS